MFCDPSTEDHNTNFSLKLTFKKIAKSNKGRSKARVCVFDFQTTNFL